MRFYPRLRKTVGIIGEPLFVETLLHIVRLSEPDGAIAFLVARVDPIVAIPIMEVIVTAEEYLITFQDGYDRAVMKAPITGSSQNLQILSIRKSR
jgi:hypothetical protein